MGGALAHPVLATFDQVKDVEGTIPASIGHLPNLEQLYLFSNTMRMLYICGCGFTVLAHLSILVRLSLSL